jgi:stage II sporulation protein D
MRRLTALAVSLAVLVLAAAAAASSTRSTAAPAPAFVLTGSGNGHGVGLSQYGAYAQAQAGKTAAEILAFYFPGTQPGHRPNGKLRVLLDGAAKSLAISSSAPFTVKDGAGQAHQLPAGPLTLEPDLQLPLDGVATTVTGPLTFVPSTGALLSLGDRSYRGSFEISSNGSTLRAIDVVGLEAYVRSVVAGEVPSSWPAAALEAQAVAARSYALATVLKGKPWDLYADGRSQQYQGASIETPQTTAAVKATAGSVLLYGNLVATTFYSSSSGGRTQSGLDAFGLEVPYLPAQADPWDEASPFHLWPPRLLTGKQIAKLLGLSAPAVDVQARFSPSGRVAALTVVTADGSSLALAGAEARKRLKLRSTAFHLATLGFLTPPTGSSPGVPLQLAGIARDARSATLERLLADGTWATVTRRLPVTATGTFAVVVHPKQTTTYRLSASGLAGPTLTISVVGTQS